jgi:hypothetical protein
MWRTGLIATLLLTAAAVARADAIDDATAGLNAFNQGDPRSAVKLLTGAIESGQLSGDNLELAYVTRGKAELQNDAPDHARRDADRALALNLNDQDAISLWFATTIRAQPGDGRDSPTAVHFACQNDSSSASHFEFQVDFAKNWVRSANLGEVGRKLDVKISSTTIAWHAHEEVQTRGGQIAHADQNFIFDRASGRLIDGFVDATGAQVATYWHCHSAE